MLASKGRGPCALPPWGAQEHRPGSALRSGGSSHWAAEARHSGRLGAPPTAALSPPSLLPPLLSSLLQEPLVFGELNIKGQKSHYIIKTQQDRN